MIFRKYEIAPSTWATLQKKIQKTVTTPEGTEQVWDLDQVAILVELGKLCKAWGVDPEGMPVCTTLATKLSVDIVWQADEHPDFVKYKIWCDPVGFHSLGETLDHEYAVAYCAANPAAAYCQPPAPIEL